MADLRQAIIDWLDDNYHFGEAQALIKSDDQSFLQSGVLNSLGFVELILFIEKSYGLKLNRKELTPRNFDSLNKVVAYVSSHPGYRPA